MPQSPSISLETPTTQNQAELPDEAAVAAVGHSEEKIEQETQETGLGLLFQNRLSQLPARELPPDISEAGGIAGLLSTNEDLPDSTISHVRHSEKAPNGYVFGAGVGNIFSMPLLYPEGQRPRAILCVDIVPEVVLTGRIFTQLLAEAGDFTVLNASIQNVQSLRQAYDRVIAAETNTDIRNRLQTVPLDQIIKGINSVINYEYLPSQGYKQKAPNHSERVSVLAVIRNNFDLYQSLAKQGNIGVGYADMTKSPVLEIVKEIPGFSRLRNVIYMSNVIDHLTQRGTDLSHLDDMMDLILLGDTEERGNWFIDTTNNSLDYRLRAANIVPIYNSTDVS